MLLPRGNIMYQHIKYVAHRMGTAVLVEAGYCQREITAKSTVKAALAVNAPDSCLGSTQFENLPN